MKLQRSDYFVRFLHRDRSLSSRFIPDAAARTEGLGCPVKEEEGLNSTGGPEKVLEEHLLVPVFVARRVEGVMICGWS